MLILYDPPVLQRNWEKVFIFALLLLKFYYGYFITVRVNQQQHFVLVQCKCCSMGTKSYKEKTKNFWMRKIIQDREKNEICRAQCSIYGTLSRRHLPAQS